MPDDNEMKVTDVIYAGKFYTSKGKLADCFYRTTDLDNRLLYSGRRTIIVPVGGLATVKMSDEDRIDFNSLTWSGENVDADQLAEYSAEDAAARRAHSNESARKKVNKANRQAWLEMLEPIRKQYRNASLPQRRAMRQLIVEWLDMP